MTCAATIYVSNLESTSAFYEASFAFEVVAEELGDFRVLDSPEWTLSLVQIPEEIAATITLSDPPARREETPIKLSFLVPRIDSARTTITDLGGQVDEVEWEFRGFRHCDFLDPEGNVGQLRQRDTSAP